jgi:hypothetical protein
VIATLKSSTEEEHIHGLAMEQWRFMAQVTKHETKVICIALRIQELVERTGRNS